MMRGDGHAYRFSSISIYWEDATESVWVQVALGEDRRLRSVYIRDARKRIKRALIRDRKSLNVLIVELASRPNRFSACPVHWIDENLCFKRLGNTRTHLI
jgi:hypothetical protein